jgi:hypothetical protein
MRRHRQLNRLHRRSLTIRAWRSLGRPGVRSLPGSSRGLKDLSEALSAFGRAIRCHRRLARLAPSFFDSAVVDREARERLERRRWMESWEPILEKVYGPAAASAPRADPMEDQTPLPGPRTQRAVERELAGWQLWMAVGSLALARHRQRRPHAVPSLIQLCRLIRIGTDFGRLACGLETCQPAPPVPPDGPDFEEALARVYGKSGDQTTVR